jgi:enolase-phosphatase E1
MKVLLLDIEGTTTSISFVYDVLFPFARRAFEETFEGRGLLVGRWDDPEVRAAVALMGGGAGSHAPNAAAGAALALMHADVKDTGLKLLQGMAWRSGYERGEIRGHLFSDVPGALAEVTGAGWRVAIYSSGSVEAQRLIFGYSERGDLTPLISDYFDTTTGPKKEAASYRAIAQSLDVPPDAIVFCSDHPDELKAAREAGCEVWLAVRPGNPPVSSEAGAPRVASLDELVARVLGPVG